MKRFLLIMLAVCSLAACKKSASISPGLFGKWELRRMYGGFAGFDSTYKAGNGRIYQFNGDSTYKYFYNNKLSKQGIFHYRKNGYVVSSSEKHDQILFDNPTYGDMVILSGTKLTIGNAWSDGIATDYEKIQN